MVRCSQRSWKHPTGTTLLDLLRVDLPAMGCRRGRVRQPRMTGDLVGGCSILLDQAPNHVLPVQRGVEWCAFFATTAPTLGGRVVVQQP
jgi:hypothetical protein